MYENSSAPRHLKKWVENMRLRRMRWAVTQRAAAPFPADCVAIQSQVPTCSFITHCLRKNWLAARNTTILIHSLEYLRIRGGLSNPYVEIGEGASPALWGAEIELKCWKIEMLRRRALRKHCLFD